MELYLRQLVFGSRTLVTTPYQTSVTSPSTVDLTAIGSSSDHPQINTERALSVSVHARLSEDPGSVQFSVVRYTKDANGVLQLQEAEEPYILSSLDLTDGSSRHLSAPLDFSTKGADVIKLVTTIVSAAEVDLWARAY